MHHDLIVFEDQKAATEWVNQMRPLLWLYAVCVEVIHNPTAKFPSGCSIVFKP
jgi:hypothetical protein